jgi:GFO/IDH/MocA oxidoreductase family protein
MAEALKIGLVGLDTSHVTAFTSLLNDASNPHHVAGGKVVAGYPGLSKDFEPSWSRVEGFTKTLREKHGVEIKETPEAVAEAVDLLFITSVDGRVHREHFERTVKFKRPTFIDKPMTVSAADAEAIVRRANMEKVPVMSCSSVRYSDNLVQALGGKREDVLGCDTFGPLSEVPTQPGLFFYGIHAVDMLVSVLGHGCREVGALHTDAGDVLTLAWPGGRSGSVRLMKDGHGKYGCTLHRKSGAQFVDASASKRPAYASMLEAILKSLPQGKSDVPADEMLDTIRIIEAANKAREVGRVLKVQ